MRIQSGVQQRRGRGVLSADACCDQGPCSSSRLQNCAASERACGLSREDGVLGVRSYQRFCAILALLRQPRFLSQAMSRDGPIRRMSPGVWEPARRSRGAFLWGSIPARWR
jgi:hypothetical protein